MIHVIEDDPAIGRGLRLALEREGFSVAWFQEGAAGLAASVEAPALVLLDVGLPDIDGIELCRRLREANEATTIVMLTARTEEADIVIGLDAGADDYVTKPFRLAELLARLRAHLRRQDRGHRVGPQEADAVDLGSLRVDRRARQVWANGREIVLRPREYDLLDLLTSNAGRAVTREVIMTEVWDAHWYGSTKTLDTHVSALRRKLGTPAPVTIATLRGVGYRLEAG
jgi:DNA-binding response OmpR family regulator